MQHGNVQEWFDYFALPIRVLENGGVSEYHTGYGKCYNVFGITLVHHLVATVALHYSTLMCVLF